jgi:hypothetical protein
MEKAICVYCSSSDAVDKIYFETAKKLGELIPENGYNLVFGGSEVGLMGELVKSVYASKGKITGIVPKFIKENCKTFEYADEMIVTNNLRDRKALMEENADAFVALPGGFGTLEEILEVLTLKQLGYHNKPVIFINTDGFYDKLIELFEHLYAKHFAKPGSREMYYIAQNAEDAIQYILNYKPQTLISKWY